MSTALPLIRGDSAAIYPFSQTVSFSTLVTPHQNGTEQRSARRLGVVKFAVPYPMLNQSQKNTLRAMFSTALGAAATDLTLTFGGITYTGLSLDSDIFSAAEGGTMQYDCPLVLTQIIGQDLTPGTAGTAFPTLANGAMAQLPYTQRKRYQTVSAVAGGVKWARSEFAGSLSGYPTDGLFSWTLDERRLSDADLATRLAHFIANAGRLRAFNFTDEDSTTYTKAHYAMDEMVINYAGPDDAAVRIELEATA